MDEKNIYDRNESMRISLEQQKAISTPLRSRIIAMLYDEPLTSKQVADILQKNAGTIYYHIQQLLKNEILIIEKTEVNRGVIEKYYRSKARLFRVSNTNESISEVKEGYVNIYLSEELLEKMNNEIIELMLKYGSLSYQERMSTKQNEYTFEYGFKKSEGESGDEKN